MRFLSRALFTTLLVCSAAVPLQAATTTFEAATDLDGYTVNNNNDSALTLVHDAAYGAGSPITGGLQFQSTASTEKNLLAVKTLTTGAYTQWSHSVLLSPKEIDDLGFSPKAEVRLGFAVNNATANLKEYFRNNYGIYVKLKAEHKSGKLRDLEMEGSSSTSDGGTGYVESKTSAKVTQTNSIHFDSWLRLSVTAVRTGTADFSVTYKLESLGPAGVTSPVEIGTLSQTVTNASLATASQVQAGFAFNSNNAANIRVYLDDHDVTFSAVAPPAPMASAATNVNAFGFTANWAAGVGGYATGYVLEVSKQSDNFAANKFIAADGTENQAAGITINSSAAVSQVMSALDPLTAYVYRLKAVNGAGNSAASSTINVTTLSEVANVQPTLDAIPSQVPVMPTAGQQTVNLTGITAGFGDDAQYVTVTAQSSNTSVIPHPSVTYNIPDTTAILRYTPTSVEGTATITVTVNDLQSMDNTRVRTFDVVVRTPPVAVNFGSATDLNEFNLTTQNGTFAYNGTAGIGDPAGGGVTFTNTMLGSEPAALAIRTQPYPGPNPTLMKSSIFINARNMNDSATKGKAEVRLGFADSTANIPSEYKKFFEQGRSAVSVQLNIEHDPGDGKVNSIKAKMMNYNGSNKTDSVELAVSDAETFEHWLKLSFEVVSVGSAQVSMTVKVEDYGTDGTVLQGTVFQSSAFTAVNTNLLAANWIYAGFMATTEKATLQPMYLDNHTVEVMSVAPGAPTALAANQVTSNGFNANWQPAGGSYASAFLVEVSTVAANFGPNSFIGADGSTGNAAGFTLPFPDLRLKRITGLLPSTAYRYRIRSSNIAGSSSYSDPVDVTTLAPGENSAPTMDAIADPMPIVKNGGEQKIIMTGISNGGENAMTETLTVTASSSNTALIPHPTVDYFDPEPVGQLFYTPEPGATGTALITVTVQDSSGAVNNTLTHTFTVAVVTPVPVDDFGSALSGYIVHTSEAGLSWNATGGVAGAGGLDFTRTTTMAEHVALALRSQVYDARVASHMSTSAMINMSAIAGITSGKDKLDFFLGFIGGATPASNYKDTFNKTHPALGVKVKMEHEFGSTEKDRKLEVELFTGPSDNKSGKESISPLTVSNHWLKVEFFAVRAGYDNYYTSYVISDCGVDGTATPTVILTSGLKLFTNSSFFEDGSIYAGFQLNGEKSAHTTLRLDRHEVVVNTTAADAPESLDATSITSTGFMANWAASPVGHEAQSFVLEVSTLANNFAPNTFISATGTGAQAAGIPVAGAAAESLAITGLQSATSYVYRVRSVRNAEQSEVRPAEQVQTFTPPVGSTYASWKNAHFPGQQGNAAVSGPGVDNDHDGFNNALEFALGLNPVVPEFGGATVVSGTAGSKLRMTFRRRANSTSITYTPQACGNMAAWSDVGITTVSVSLPDVDGMETVVVEDAVLMSAAEQRFMRVQIAIQE